MSFFKCPTNLDNFLVSFFNLITSLIRTIAKINTKMEMRGIASTVHTLSSFCASFFNCHPNSIGKKNRIIQPITKRPTAHSRFIINHSRVNHSIFNSYRTHITIVTYMISKTVQAIIDIT